MYPTGWKSPSASHTRSSRPIYPASSPPSVIGRRTTRPNFRPSPSSSRNSGLSLQRHQTTLIVNRCHRRLPSCCAVSSLPPIPRSNDCLSPPPPSLYACGLRTHTGFVRLLLPSPCRERALRTTSVVRRLPTAIPGG